MKNDESLRAQGLFRVQSNRSVAGPNFPLERTLVPEQYRPISMRRSWLVISIKSQGFHDSLVSISVGPDFGEKVLAELEAHWQWFF